MNKRKKRVQIIAVIGLIGIFFSIVWTGLLVIFSSRQTSLTESELEEYLRGMSGAIEDISVEGEEVFSGSLDEEELKEDSFSWDLEEVWEEENLSWTWEEDLEINE